MTEKKKIQELTAEQEALLDVYADRWTKIGLDCSPTNWEAAIAALDVAYVKGGLKPPPNVFLADSPLAMVEGRVRSVRGPAKPFALPDLSQVIYGQHGSGWVSFYAYMREVLGLVEETEDFVGGNFDLPLHCGWCAVYEEVAFISGKPKAIRMNTAGGLHSLDAPAIEYPDGFAIYAVNDVVVPAEWVINRATLDVRLALDHPNVEQRAVAGLLIGWDKVLKEVGARVVDRNPNEYVGTLLEATVSGTTRRFLEVKCPTGRTMVLSVDPALETAVAANAWTYGDDSEFESEGRT